MIVALTDGVGLTNLLAKNHTSQSDRVNILSDFFRVQIEAFNDRACGPAWHVVKTTGDGLFISVDEDEATNDNVFDDVLMSMKQAKAACESLDVGIQLRSVVHHCARDEIIKGERLNIREMAQPNRKLGLDVNAVNSDVFGLEIIRLARLASIAKGPFHLLTDHFIGAWTGKRKLGAKKQQLQEMRVKFEHYDVDDEPIHIPRMKGFEAIGEDFSINFEEPYLVWEINYDRGVSS
jgi:hypothetical protein